MCVGKSSNKKKKIKTRGKNKGVGMQPGSICRNKGCTAVTVEMKVFSTRVKTLVAREN